MTTKPVPSPEQPVPVFFIDAVNKQVCSVSHDGSLEQLYKWIDCDTIDYTARQHNGDGIFCNDFLPDDLQQVAFKLRSSGQIVYGNGVWTGSNEEGDTVTPSASLTEVIAETEFLGPIPYKPAPIYVFSW